MWNASDGKDSRQHGTAVKNKVDLPKGKLVNLTLVDTVTTLANIPIPYSSFLVVPWFCSSSSGQCDSGEAAYFSSSGRVLIYLNQSKWFYLPLQCMIRDIDQDNKAHGTLPRVSSTVSLREFP